MVERRLDFWSCKGVVKRHDGSLPVESAAMRKPVAPQRTRCRHRSLGRSIRSYLPSAGTMFTSCAFLNPSAIKFHQMKSAES